jgi:hypothetical protein
MKEKIRTFLRRKCGAAVERDVAKIPKYFTTNT